MGERWSGWAGLPRRIAVSPRWPMLAGAVLALFALTEVALRLALPAAVARAVTSAQPAVRTAASSPGVATARHLGQGLTLLTPQAGVVIFLLCLAATLPLAFLRPAAAAVTITVACVLALVLPQQLAAQGTLAGLYGLTVAGAAAELIAVCRLGRSGSPVLAVALTVPLPVLALTVPLPVLALAGGAAGETRVLTLLLASLAPAAALAGIARRARSEALADSAVRQAITGSLLEHTARGERARIARELHDVVAHHISMVAVQAETARLATPGLPPAGEQRLLAIGDTARAALTEMRRLLGVLREDARAATPGPPAADRQPQPGLRELNELLDEARDASGAGTRLILRGSPVPLEAGVELAAFRIVQEALTNARRHAAGAAVDVELHYTGDGLRLIIRDNGPGPPAVLPPGGHGLPGMRERAAAVGGELQAGAAAGGGFLVTARLPGKGEAP